MAETLTLSGTSKHEQYTSLLPQIRALIEHETDPVANLANVAAALRQAFNFFWVGFYRVQNNELVLGPFQGPIACTRIAKGKGVCGAAYEKNATQLVPDVDLFPGHIACSSLSRSEIVVPVHNSTGDVIAVLDVDSDEINAFDEVDQEFLEAIVALIKNV